MAGEIHPPREKIKPALVEHTNHAAVVGVVEPPTATTTEPRAVSLTALRLCTPAALPSQKPLGQLDHPGHPSYRLGIPGVQAQQLLPFLGPDSVPTGLKTSSSSPPCRLLPKQLFDAHKAVDNSLSDR